LAAAAAAALALASAGMGNALAAPGDAASAPDAASVSYANGGQVTVRPGQSLNDVAIAVTQSHDKATLARASRALFDANPNAFMSHDPSRLRLGAVLTVPVLDASGALAASAAGVAAAASAPAPASASNAAPAADTASAVAQVNAAAASAASAAAHATAPAAPAMSASGSAAAEAGSATLGGATSSAPVAGSQATALPASGTHEWSGSIQPSASEAAEGASAAGGGTTPATGAAQSASQPRAQVSSLQQLLALKNRVLMELQKHGIGGTPPATGTASNNVAQPATGVSSAAAVPSHGTAPVASTSKDVGMSQTELSVAAAVGAALVALLAAWRMGRRKRERAAAQAAAADDALVPARATGPQDVVSPQEQVPVREASDAGDDAAVVHASALAAAEREAAEGDAAAREMAERIAAERDAEVRRAAAREAAEKAAAERVAEEQAAAERATAEHATAEHPAEELPATHPNFSSQNPNAPQHVREAHDAPPAAVEPAQLDAKLAPSVESGFNPEPLPAPHHDDLDSATTAASLAAAAELGAEALPQAPLEPVDEAFLHGEPIHRLQWDDAPVVPHEPSVEPQHPLSAPPPVDLTEPHLEPHTTSAFGEPFSDAAIPAAPSAVEPQQTRIEPPYTPLHPAQTAPSDAAPALEHQEPLAPPQSTPTAAPTEFPRDAVDAFGSLDMPLPPRVESSADALQAPVSLSTQPVASPEITTKLTAPLLHPDDDAPHIVDEITAGTAGQAAVAGLGAGFGASGFGALKLDFDLELPPSPAQPLPAFTQTDLGRIARNKLELATEYIELGDLSGARALINEVIETNDPGTRTEARALLSTLAPLS
jgi:FimV-like protein